MNRLCNGMWRGGDLEPGVFHAVDSPLFPIREERVDDSDRDDPLRHPRRQELDATGLEH